MKVGSDANYNVRIRARAWEEDPGESERLYAGMWTFDLNQVVSVSFVPDLTAVPRPWSVDALPDDIDDFTQAWQVRLVEVLTTSYSVTPDPERAGAEEQFPWPWPGDDGRPMPPCTVFYVTPEEFERLAADLAELSQVAGNVHSTVRRDEITDHEVVAFVERRVLGSPLFTADHARAVGR